MKLVRGEVVPEPAVHVGFMVVGDGGHDEKVMKALFKRFDDEKFVLMPQDRPSLKLVGSVDLAAELIGRFGKDVLIVIDKEFFDEARFESLLKQRFSNYEVTRRDDGFWLVKVTRGARTANLCVAVMGTRKDIWEVEAAIIREFYGEEVAPTEEEIKRFLRERGVKIYDLIEQLKDESLDRVFPRQFIDFLKRWGAHEV